jgi:hypothetical protein
MDPWLQAGSRGLIAAVLVSRLALTRVQRAQQGVNDAVDVVQRQRVQYPVLLLPLPGSTQRADLRRQAAVGVQRSLWLACN